MPARLYIITGPMFSGKSEELIRRINRATYARKRVLVLKPAIDTRSKESEITARKISYGRSVTSTRHHARSISTKEDFWTAVRQEKPDVLAIDEAQFFDESWFIKAISTLLLERKKDDLLIITAGLDLTANLEPFGPMPTLLAMADEVLKLSAVCFLCGADGAPLTQKIGGSKETIELGDLGRYEARCRACHEKS